MFPPSMLTSTAKTAPTAGSMTGDAASLFLHRIVSLSSRRASTPFSPSGPSSPPRRQRTSWGAREKSCVFVRACVPTCVRACVRACMRACRVRACVRAGGRAGVCECVHARARTLAHLRVDGVRDEAATVHDELGRLLARGGERAHVDDLLDSKMVRWKVSIGRTMFCTRDGL